MVSTAVDILSKQRIQALDEPVWIGYPRAVQIREQLEFLLTHPKTHRMPNMAIIGETNNGKTMLLQNFYRKHAPSEDPNVEKIELPVLMIQTPPAPDENRLYDALLDRLFALGHSKEPPQQKVSRLKTILTRLNTKLLVFDEFQHTIAGTHAKQRLFLNSLKYLGNELKIPMVVAATMEGLNALQADPQIKNRFDPAFLPKWVMGEDYLRLLVSIERVLGLKQPSNLAGEKLAQHILHESEGMIGEMMQLLRLLAKRAIRSGEERITIADLKKENLKALNWCRPSDRHKVP